MTTATLAAGNRTMDTVDRPRRSLEELVDRVFAALFSEQPETAEQSATRSIHEAQRLRQAGDIEAALGVLARVDTAKAMPREVRWAFCEWVDLAKRRFGGEDALLYRQGVGRAAVLIPRADGMLEAVAVLGLPWQPGKMVSRRSLRGLRPL